VNDVTATLGPAGDPSTRRKGVSGRLPTTRSAGRAARGRRRDSLHRRARADRRAAQRTPHDKPYVLLAFVDFPRPDPARGLAPHLVVLDDGRGVNLGRIARITRSRAFNPAPADVLYHDGPVLEHLLFNERKPFAEVHRRSIASAAGRPARRAHRDDRRPAPRGPVRGPDRVLVTPGRQRVTRRRAGFALAAVTDPAAYHAWYATRRGAWIATRESRLLQAWLVRDSGASPQTSVAARLISQRPGRLGVCK